MIAFVVFDVVQTIRSGGSVHVPGGVGPGAWLGIAGSLLSAQPAITGRATTAVRPVARSAQIIGYASMVGASLSTAFNLCWRVRYALQAGRFVRVRQAEHRGHRHGGGVRRWWRWPPSSSRPGGCCAAPRLPGSRPVALGASTLVAGILVWLLPVGRDIDAFHGIAQNTSTAGVGYEGYLAWAAAAAIFAPRALSGYSAQRRDDEEPLAGGGPKGLAAHRRMVPGVGADADHRPRRRGDVELPVLALRHPDAGRVRSGHRGPGDLASGQPGQRVAVGEADLVAVRTAVRR